MRIRAFTNEDYPEICRWADEEYGTHPEENQFPDTTFIAEIDDERVACVSLLLTNSKRICMAENLLSNPDVTPRVRKEAIEELATYSEIFAKALEYRGMLCLAPNEILMRRYRQLGYQTTLQNVTTMTKQI